MNPPTCADLPPPPVNKSGWPWREETVPLPSAMPDGQPWPKVSIVTPSYNQGQFIEETIRSVLLQGYPNLEYIVIDGGSTDNSVEIIKKYEPWLTYWASEPDRGQSHAINKGLARATGIIFNWINSDDLLMPRALEIVATALTDHDVVAGACVNFGEDIEDIVITPTDLSPRNMILRRDKVVFQQPSQWLRRDYVSTCGGIDEHFHYAFDWDLMLRYLGLYPRVSYIQDPIARFRLHRDSKTVAYRYKFLGEEISILQKLIAWQLESRDVCQDSPRSSDSLGRRSLDLPDAEEIENEIESLQRACKDTMRRVGWWSAVTRLLSDDTRPRWQRVLGVLWAIRSDPRIRWSRWTLGAIRLLYISRAPKTQVTQEDRYS